MLDNDRDSQLTETEGFYSDQELATDESSCEEYNTRRLCGIQWTRRERRTSICKTRFNSVRMVVQC